MSSNKTLPNLVVIGAMKCGTTSLHDYLACHPDIFMSKKKELDFFIRKDFSEDDIESYKNNFDSRYLVNGESSQNYTKVHQYGDIVSGRIINTIPNARIIYIIRDPISRIVSHYHEALEGGYAPTEGLNESIRSQLHEHHYVLTSKYNLQILPFVREFGMEKIEIFCLEDLIVNRVATMNRLFKFLGIAEVAEDLNFDFVSNSVNDKRHWNGLSKIIYSDKLTKLRRSLPQFLSLHLRSSRLIRQILTKPIKKVSLDDSTTDVIRELLSSDISKLRALTGSTYDKWSL